MITVENVDVWGFEHAVRGMRNPMNSWDKSDSEYMLANFCDAGYRVGDNDLDLMNRLYKAGPEHRKYLRQIMVSLDITAPLYWWKEFDTYKVGTVANSCSTMHKIAAKEFELADFSHEHLSNNSIKVLNHTIKCMNDYREEFQRLLENFNIPSVGDQTEIERRFHAFLSNTFQHIYSEHLPSSFQNHSPTYNR